MSDTSRRDVLTTAAVLAAGSVLALPAPTAAAPDEPFRIAPSANYLELRRLGALINEAHRLRYCEPNVGKADAVRLHDDFMTYGEQIKALLAEMTAQPPRIASDLLDFAAVMLWRHTSLYDGGDPCEALNEAGAHATIQNHTAYELAWAVFSLAADRTEPARRGEWEPPMRWDPDL
jgi:hypothetical protein